MKYHISKNGNIVECTAHKRACPVQPDDIEQCHSSDYRFVENFMLKQYDDIYSGVIRKKFKKKFVISDALIGDDKTDVERLSELTLLNYADIDDNFWRAQTWLTDTEGRPIAFIEFLKRNSTTLELCDIEVRPEFRGRKISKRIIQAVEKKMNMTMIHNGGYTADGLKHIAPLFHSGEDLRALTEKEVYSPMSFVMDWDRQYSANN